VCADGLWPRLCAGSVTHSADAAAVCDMWCYMCYAFVSVRSCLTLLFHLFYFSNSYLYWKCIDSLQCQLKTFLGPSDRSAVSTLADLAVVFDYLGPCKNYQLNDRF